MTVRDFLGFVIDPKNNIDVDMSLDDLFSKDSKYFYSIDKAAEILECGSVTILTMIAEGRLKAYKLHNAYYICREDLIFKK